MSSGSALRRSSPLIHRFPAVQRFHFRQFSAVPPPPSESAYSQISSHGNGKTNILRWISAGIITSSTLAVSLYSFSSPSLDSRYLSFADWSAPASATTSTSTTAASIGYSESPLHNRNNKPQFLFGDAFRRKIFFNYEKRIRMRSPPEKVFEYFASICADDGEVFMTPADLMRALVPVFPPSESHLVRDGYLRGERSPGDLRCDPSQFFMLFDTNSDGLISFKEYLFFVTLLSIPESSFSVAFKMFDLDCNGEIDREEFKKVMTLMRAQNRQGAVHSNGRRGGRKFGGSIENGGLVEYFFERDGNNLLHHDKFVQFLRDLHHEMVKLEFAHYDYKLRGTISAKDFALSMVASSNSRAEPINPRTISESPATNLSLRNVLAREQIHQGFNHENLEHSRNHNSGSRAGQSCSFPLLPHEMLTWHNRRRLSEATPGTREYDSFVPSPFGPSSAADEVGTTSRVRRSSVLAMDAPGGGGNGRDVLSAVEGRQRLDYILNDPFEIENGFVEFRDPHRDMRFDVDNMSYEELLDLEERIGSVSSGLNKSYIRGSIRQRQYEAIRASLNSEPCSICREDYVDGVNIGKLDCGHEFHTRCIQQWLILKNICPICKMTAIET